jgi:hypothetical protein
MSENIRWIQNGPTPEQDAATNAQIAAVPHQSDAVRELDAKVRAAAGDKLGPVKIRMKATGATLVTGFEHARKAVLSGVATLVEE